MKKFIFVLFAIVCLFACAVSASAAELPVEMAITAQPDKLIYTAEDAVSRTESAFDEATQSVKNTTYNYYPISFEGLEITFTYADASTKVFVFDDVLSLVGGEWKILNKTVQNANKQWTAGNSYDIVLACGDLQATYQVQVIERIPDPQTTIEDICIVREPAKLVYFETEKYTESGFGANGEVIQYDAYLADLQGLLVCVLYEDGSYVHCSPAIMTALTGIEMQVNDHQSDAQWKLGKNTIDLTFGTFADSFAVYLDVENHQFATYTATGNDTHRTVCVYCEQTFTFDCTGGTATCDKQAVCTVCNTSYGKTLPHNIYYTTAYKTHTELCKDCTYKNENIPHQMKAGAYEAAKTGALYTCQICAYETYAQAMGDVEENGVITAADARYTLRNAVALETLTPRQMQLADMDYDGKVTAADARKILRIAVSLDPSDDYLPVGMAS